MSLGDRALVALLDSVSLEHCRAHPGTSYARLRMFGSIGFFALALLLGQVLTLRGDRPGDRLVPLTIAACAVGYALAARRMAPAPAAHPDRPSGRELLGLLRDRRLLALFAVCAVHWAACVPYSLLLGVFVRDLGLPARVTGAGISAAVVAEILVMMAYPWVARNRSPRALLVASFVASAVRWALLSRATHPAAIVALQALHGLTYGLFWSTLVQLVGAQVPPQLRATGLALCQALVFGLGNALGAKVAGLGYDHYGSVGPVFLWSAAADLAIAVLLGALLARRLVRGAPPPGGVTPPRAAA
jgi:MFS transporter, PPP family, 3-phenylpropionic acid transporter